VKDPYDAIEGAEGSGRGDRYGWCIGTPTLARMKQVLRRPWSSTAPICYEPGRMPPWARVTTASGGIRREGPHHRAAGSWAAPRRSLHRDEHDVIGVDNFITGGRTTSPPDGPIRASGSYSTTSPTISTSGAARWRACTSRRRPVRSTISSCRSRRSRSDPSDPQGAGTRQGKAAAFCWPRPRRYTATPVHPQPESYWAT